MEEQIVSLFYALVHDVGKTSCFSGTKNKIRPENKTLSNIDLKYLKINPV